ncbi:Uncharacterised protein [Weissella viridescens]|uniref:Uncharacterized protein n=1 Tax=Weissella viridescens TaxID=1629 RepID=A0A380NZL8_WEIVI|nr:Uncharacterised protein [Weissella viridescens]
MTPETRTAETQLSHAIKAQDAVDDENWHLAQSQYRTALEVDDGLTNINSAIQEALNEVNRKMRPPRRRAKHRQLKLQLPQLPQKVQLAKVMQLKIGLNQWLKASQ